ncbi:hypothetical protein F5B17DRAFT_409093 [Nemania serpens]|nr:hypothetical protein F5B17DRAFT_409093 [Nemania serpens]
MTIGPFRAVSDDIASDISNLEYLNLDELMIARDLVHFIGIGEPRFRTWDGAQGGNSLRRTGKEVNGGFYTTSRPAHLCLFLLLRDELDHKLQ